MNVHVSLTEHGLKGLDGQAVSFSLAVPMPPVSGWVAQLVEQAVIRSVEGKQVSVTVMAQIVDATTVEGIVTVMDDIPGLPDHLKVLDLKQTITNWEYTLLSSLLIDGATLSGTGTATFTA